MPQEPFSGSEPGGEEPEGPALPPGAENGSQDNPEPAPGPAGSGPDKQALAALEARDFGSLKRLIPEPVDERLQLRDDLDTALAHLREVRDKYWDRDWRREHRGGGRYPENELWEAVEGYLDLLDASRPTR